MKSFWMVVVAVLAGLEASWAGAPEVNPLGPWYLADQDRRWHVDGLLGVEAEPDYVGSDDTEIEAAGLLRAFFKDGRGNRYSVSFGEIGAVFYVGARWAIEVAVEDEEGREAAETDLAGLPDGRETLEGEFSLYRRFGDGYAFAQTGLDLQDRGKGSVFFLGYVRDFLSADERWRWSSRFDVSWADTEHMQTEFGLDAVDATTLGLTEYRAEGGLKSATAGFGVQRYFQGRWSILGSLEVEQYFSEAADSPLIDVLGSDLTYEAVFGVFFRF